MPAITAPVTFRLYPSNMYQDSFGIVGSIATRGYGMWFNDIEASVIPTPAAGLGGLLGLSLITRRRRA